jgi:hypothetical protein
MAPETRSMAAARQGQGKDEGSKPKTSRPASHRFGRRRLRRQLLDGLCHRCYNLRLGRVFRDPRFRCRDHFIRNITWSNDYCEFCNLMDRAFGIRKGIKRRSPVGLWANPSSRDESSPRCILSFNAVMLSNQPSMLSNRPRGKRRYLLPQPNGVNTLRLVKPLVCFDMLKSWLGQCKDHHTKYCGALEHHTSLPCSVSSFRLIDCETGRIVPGTNQPYVALSYVWGNGADRNAPSNDILLFQDLPCTIRDAITATRGLGFGYLWVDRYCINQEDKSELAEQTSKMDLIYQGAQVTIIAASGENPHHGLPGIRARQLTQAYGNYGKHFLISSLQNPMRQIKRSKWSTEAGLTRKVCFRAGD